MRSGRRGNYTVMMTLVLTSLLGFGALAVDVSYMRLSASMAQDVADAAAHAAVMTLRRTGDGDEAEAAAREVLSLNRVGNGTSRMRSFELGTWDVARAEPFTLLGSGDSPNAARVSVAGDNPLFLGQFFGRGDFVAGGKAVAATRTLEVVLVLDITNSFRTDFHYAREASLVFLDGLKKSHGNDDSVGMALFYNIYGVEYTPLTLLRTEADGCGALCTQWGLLDTASKDATNAFSPDLDHPDMPREYTDEFGTDHHVGVRAAVDMFAASPDPTAYRAMVLLTDGRPFGIDPKAGSIRASKGYVESRWDQYVGPPGNSADTIRTLSVDWAETAYADYDANVWVVSFDVVDTFLEDMVQGDGRFYYTRDPASLVDIFAEIQRSLPLSIVQ